MIYKKDEVDKVKASIVPDGIGKAIIVFYNLIRDCLRRAIHASYLRKITESINSKCTVFHGGYTKPYICDESKGH